MKTIRWFLVLLLLVEGLAGVEDIAMGNNMLTVGIPKVPDVALLDFAKVPTLDCLQTMTMVGGSPFYSYDNHLEKIYFKRVTPSSDYKTWDFEFIDNARFSDGTPLTATHWYHSIARAVKLGLGVHFNPREELVGAKESKDGYCGGLQITGNTVTLRLVQSNKSLPTYIPLLAAPYHLNYFEVQEAGKSHLLDNYSAPDLNFSGRT